MGQISRKTQQLFERWGQRGGRARARRLSSLERVAIAANAARTRWNRGNAISPVFLSSVRLEDGELDNPVYLEEILSDGTWEDWKRIYQIISDRPFGDTAVAVEKVCSSVKMYGVAILWQGILRSVRGGVL